MKEIILLKYGEIALKGLNKQSFESVLLKNVRHRLRLLGRFETRAAQSTIVVEPLEECDLDLVEERLSHVFGISAITRAAVAQKEMGDIARVALEYLADSLPLVSTFKVEAKRSDKTFPLKTPQICEEIGGLLLERFDNLSVDLHDPEYRVVVEVRDFGAYVHGVAHKAAGGMPVGSSGMGMLMLSGGIDSPVAGYMMAKRGVQLCCIHFESPPYTSERAKLKVLTLADKMTEYCNTFEVHVVPFTRIQEEIKRGCKEEYFTVIMRRVMMMVANRVAKARGCGAIITGESLAQVASQTMQAIGCTDAASELPVLRPLIGMDKLEIVDIARKIDTFETSILPYEDCCTVFTPRHPKTRPVLEQIVREEEKLDLEPLIEEAVSGTEKLVAILR
ncbi:tRNA uracil 4-sulfurtransferase ThiI [Bittarella massiliensis (ex Durand et al. 2017)]|uniref:Probable tRNA sulfurtransferase n=1 Tax=Bittarella massiliensis (ex Durand et al. 2017) TaxID=1720313 RepID=A0ABW9WYF7_9FIRM|nr:tRNA uracil 4-sulfurtransferase ThiI [Bittarella massiliensis (ex Durand et al. 2017)]MZL70518.1 tRNA 4-thiouridine(8) synthase ThiI [Bittarella massiliensis (ex Durand et al. 2017)]MZL80258.1 tRNA 4-thiouridine(8) synthase ThiI [Bittarella massiliensis (ex Durand et al. 2017)]